MMPRPDRIVTAEASFDSRCPQCDGFIAAGEAIFKIDPDDDAEPFVCETCARAAVRSR